MPHVIESAATGRSKCRGCGERIGAGTLRFGESLPNPFAEGDMTHWFHLECAAFKRPEPFLATLDALAARGEGSEGEPFRGEARRGIEHPRLPRVDGAERDPSGRAQCRACHAPIAKGAWRLRLVFYEEGRFSAAGAVHLPCVAAYIGTNDVLARVQRFAPALTAADLEAIAQEL